MTVTALYATYTESERDDLFYLRYGPMIVSQGSENIINQLKLDSERNDVAMVLYLINMIYKEISHATSKITLYNLRGQLESNVNSYARKTTDPRRKDFCQSLMSSINNHIDNRKHTLEVVEKSANENVMFGYSPIEIYEQVDNIDVDVQGAPKVSINEPINLLIHYPEFILTNAPLVYNPIEDTYTSKMDYLFELLDCDLNITCDYFTSVFKLISADHRMFYRKYMNMIKSQIEISEDKFNELLEALSIEILKDDQTVIEAYEEDYAVRMAMESLNDDIAQKILAGTPNIYDDYEGYDIEKLRSEIYRTRHIEFNRHANDYFLRSVADDKIRGYSYIEDMILVEILDKYICVPYIDVSDNYAVKAFAIDKSNNITILEDFEQIG